MVEVVAYLWEGRWGPFRISSHCKECDVTTGLLSAMQRNEFSGLGVDVQVRPWLDNWWYCLRRGAWHAPIIFVDKKKFFQHTKKKPVFVRAELAEHVKSLLDKK